MNRTIIRILGCCIAVFGFVINRASGSAEGTAFGVLYSFVGTSVSRGGYCSYSSSGLISKYNCGMGQTNNGGFNNISDCNGYSYCNETGVCCTNVNFFKNNGCTSGSSASGTGCSYVSGGWSENGSGEYQFVSCVSGYYKNHNRWPCDGGTGLTDVAELRYCCSRCSGYGAMYDGTSGFTYEWTDGENCESGWCWAAGTGVGITECRAYPDPKNQVFSDSYGTFTWADGCPYVN